MTEKNDQANFFQKMQPFIIVILFLGFLFSFGLPAFSTFSKKNVMFVESFNTSETLEAPALTICVENVSIKLRIEKTYFSKILFRGKLLR